ncbi:MAG: hypothetical protein VX617_02005 [Pseudomonadota bacterium]|nr:hypothetical protein [Pseudomonadota bacterium]
MKAFIYSLFAVAAISILSAWLLGSMELSSADVFQLKDSVRL